jgi:uncharacterized protein YutE (UPF0331/DUF86 family)
MRSIEERLSFLVPEAANRILDKSVLLGVLAVLLEKKLIDQEEFFHATGKIAEAMADTTVDVFKKEIGEDPEDDDAMFERIRKKILTHVSESLEAMKVKT